MIVSIHQQNYLPGLFTWDKIARSDVHVLFDDVQFPRGKSFTNRNRIKTPSGPLWLTLPIKNKSDLPLINGTLLAETDWARKHWKTIEANYKKAPYFKKYENDFYDIYTKKWIYLQDINSSLAGLIKLILGIKTKFVCSSELKVEGTGKEKIMNILKKLKADAYITGLGAGSQRYIDEKDFKDIELIKQDFKHPIYPQLWGKEFVPNLSIIDYIFNRGGDHFYEDLHIK